MALSRAKTFLTVCSISAVIHIVIVKQFHTLTSRPKTQNYNSSQEQENSKWKICKRLISGKVKTTSIPLARNESEILTVYKHENCDHVLHTRFAHPNVTKEEAKLPIAYGFTIYKGASLFERILRAIYMPHNVYCIHIDKKSPEAFYRAIQAIIRCLPNVLIASKRVDVVWGHISLVEAQLECMRELLESTVKWKYYISLIGQDFPLYENKEIVRALKMLNDTNSMESNPMPYNNKHRTRKVHVLDYLKKVQMTGIRKPPPPHNVPIYKGSTHIMVIREFVDFVVHSKVGRDFTEFLKDTAIPDETIYASLQQYPMAPGGISGEQPREIARALHWSSDDTPVICHGIWVRDLCWIEVKDLHWVFGKDEKEKLFVHKIPFNFTEDLIECILEGRKGRKYGTSMWKLEESWQRNETSESDD